MIKYAIAATLLLALFSTHQQPATLVLTPLKPGGIYQSGDRVGWTVSSTNAVAIGLHYVVRLNNHDEIASGDLDMSSGKASFDVKVDQPGMVYAALSTVGSTTTMRVPVAGAAVSPTELRPVEPRPRDFDAFWKSKIRELNRIPMNAVLTPKDSGMENVDYFTIQMDHVNGAHVYGQLAKPKGGGKHPAIAMYQWASPPYPLQRSWITYLAAQGWIILDIEPHNVLPDQPQSYYNALPAELKNYAAIGQDDRDKNYFLQMYLADYRAVEYLSSRPDWDGKTLVAMGTSMGGQQSLCVAGLNPRVTHVIVNEPSGCDIDAALHGRQAGYPNFQTNNPKVAATAPYFDAINFASHIHATSLVAMGFVDTVAPPAGIWTAFNQIRGRKEAAPMFESPHNNTATPSQQKPFTSRSAEWLNALVKGQPIPPPHKTVTVQPQASAITAGTAKAFVPAFE